MSGSRLDSGGLIDRATQIHFTFDGRNYVGYRGDTLASALLANGVSVIGRSFKYHRPRGLLAAGVEEPNALVQLAEGPRTQPNMRATEIELYDGLVARAVNCWPNARWDIGAAAGLFARFIPAGFYYKTFMWPNWHWFEPFIRRAAGLGHAPDSADPDRYESHHAHCDVLVIGAGPAGLSAALSAARSGARIMLCEQEPQLGGSLLDLPCTIDGMTGRDWLGATVDTLDRQPDVIIKTRTTAIGYFDHNALTLLERVVDENGCEPEPPLPRYRLWQVRAKRVILATGAIERPMVFPGNDRPGVMLASAVRQYVRRFAVLSGLNTVVFTSNDTAYATAHALLDAGGRIAAIIDRRAAPPSHVLHGARARGIKVLTGSEVLATHGGPALQSVLVRDSNGQTLKLAVDLLAISGGLNPNVQLFSQSGGGLQWDDVDVCFKPFRSVQLEESVGAARGIFDLNGALSSGHAAGLTARGQADTQDKSSDTAPISSDSGPRPTFALDHPIDRAKGAFVDFQNDVTYDDIALAARENYTSVEHLKRYTTLGMAPDQGKTSNVNGLIILGHLTGRTPAETGTTRFRFPFTPVPLGALAGRSRGKLHRPLRRLPCHTLHEAAGAYMEDFGGWLRPAYYARTHETREAACRREVMQVRERVGLFDGSPLGKIIVKGEDAPRFLDGLFANAMSTLNVRKLRYGILLNELGVVIDDGVTARLGAQEYWVGTSSGAAGRIAEWLEEWRQCEWPHYRVIVAPETSAWAVISLTGPRARAVLNAAGVDLDIGPTEFPHMTFRDGRVAGIPARIMRVSYTGEITYEINIRSDQARALWEHLMDAGASHGLSPVGIDAWDVLRTEKGYLHVGSDTDGTTSATDIGWDRILNRRDEFVGRRSLARTADRRSDRLQLVGFQPETAKPLPAGCHVQGGSSEYPSDGYVTSGAFSPTLNRWVAMGMLRGGRSRIGCVVTILTSDGPTTARVAEPCSYDIANARLAS